jgi:hypothetical protein
MNGKKQRQNDAYIKKEGFSPKTECNVSLRE